MQATKEEITRDLRRMLAEELFVEIPPEKIKDTDSLSTDIGLDSVGRIELVSLLEERYGLTIDAQQAAADLKTVGSTVDYVWNSLKGNRDCDTPIGPQAEAA